MSGASSIRAISGIENPSISFSTKTTRWSSGSASSATSTRSRASFCWTSPSNKEILVTKGRDDGTSWTKVWDIPATSTLNLQVNDLVVDAKGRSVVAGWFAGTFQLGTAKLTSGTASAMAFLARLSPAGSFTDAEAIVAQLSVANGLARDESGGLYVVGRFMGTADLGGISLKSKSPTATDGFIWYTGRGPE